MASFMNENAAATPPRNNPQDGPPQGGGGAGAPGVGGFGDILMMGHRLAQRMHQENPQFIEELRSTLTNINNPNNPQQQDDHGAYPPADKKDQ